MYRYNKKKFQVKKGRIGKTGVTRPLFFPFEKISDNVESIELPINSRNYEFFHGYDSIFTLQHWTDIIIDEKVYRSVDHYYQMMKAYDLTEKTSDKFNDSNTRNYSAVSREILKENNISRKTVDEWRTKCGLEIIQKALLAKIKQSTAFRDKLLSTGDKIICHCFATDDFYGTGCPVKYIIDWSNSMENENKTLKYPIEFPLNQKTAKHVPSIAKGRNMLGAIYIALREQIKRGRLDELNVVLTPVDQAITIIHNKNQTNSNQVSTRIPPSSISAPVPLRNLAIKQTSNIEEPRAPLDSYNAYVQQQHPQSSSQVYHGYIASNQQYNNYSNHTTGRNPLMYTEDQMMNRSFNTQSMASQLPEIPVGTVGRPNMQSSRTLEDVYNEQQQRSIVPRQSYANIAIQNQDFTSDVDMCSDALNVRQMPQAPRPPTISNQPTFQGNYEWTW